MLRIVATLALLLAPIAWSTCLEAEYRVRLPRDAKDGVDIVATFRGLPENESTLTLNEAPQIAYAKLPESTQTELPTATGQGGKTLGVEKTGPFTWTIATAGQTEVTVSYRVPLTHRTHPSVLAAHDDYEFPYRDGDGNGLLVGGPLFLEATEHRVTPRVQIDFGGTPFVTSLTKQNDGSYAPREGLALSQVTIAFGELAQREFDVNGMNVRVVFLPGQEFLAERYGEMIERIVRLELGIFQSTPAKQYLFVFTLSGVQGFGGTVKTDAIYMSVSGSTFSGPKLDEAIGHLVAHEFFHTWANELYGDELRFVNEGFTDYFAFVVLGRLGILSAGGATAMLAERIAAYESAGTASGSDLLAAGGAAFFAGGPAYTQVYAGGLVVASILDNLLRKKAHGDVPKDLDEFLRAFNNDERWDRRSDGKRTKPTLDDFLALVERSLGSRDAEMLGALLHEPGFPGVTNEYAAAGLRVKREERTAEADLRANLKGTQLLDLDTNCAAHTIGLRPGDTLRQVNGVLVSTSKEAYVAFSQPLGGRFVIEYERADETLRIDTEVPKVIAYAIPETAVTGFAAKK